MARGKSLPRIPDQPGQPGLHLGLDPLVQDPGQQLGTSPSQIRGLIELRQLDPFQR
jgi:hypothetical protein